MDAVANTERIIALIGALVVGTFAVIALRNDWKKTGLDDQVTKVLLGLMAFGCVLVFFAAVGLIGPKG
jgi:hypothetical protein